MSCVGSWSEFSRLLYLPSQLGSSLSATGTGCPWRGSREGGVGGLGGAKEKILTSKNERGFDVKGGAIRFGRGRMRHVGQGRLFWQVQGIGFGVGVDVKRLGGRAEGVGERGRAVATVAGGR